ncbi:MAG: hypothetical protein ACR65R_12750 [Methylomicrobium sp.]
MIEASKRIGQEEELQVQLPYSKESFGVPSNVYLIGTMNTADRSLAGLDIALRRRFTFEEMPLKPELLGDINIFYEHGEHGVNIEQMLSKMNERIEVLLDRDHCLGHAYFMPLKNDNSIEKLAFIFRQQIMPLLEEYFFEDWERIHWVLNDHNKSPAYQFIKKPQLRLKACLEASLKETCRIGAGISTKKHSERLKAIAAFSERANDTHRRARIRTTHDRCFDRTQPGSSLYSSIGIRMVVPIVRRFQKKWRLAAAPGESAPGQFCRDYRNTVRHVVGNPAQAYRGVE